MRQNKKPETPKRGVRHPKTQEYIEGTVSHVTLSNGSIPYLITDDNEWYFHVDSLLRVLKIPGSNHVVIFTNLKRRGVSKLYQFGVEKTYVFAQATHILSCYGLKAAAKRAGLIQFLEQNKIVYR